MVQLHDNELDRHLHGKDKDSDGRRSRLRGALAWCTCMIQLHEAGQELLRMKVQVAKVKRGLWK